MILINCPWCGCRGADEFHYAGPPRARPDPATTTRQEWRDYLYFSANPRGRVIDTWFHRMGCGQFFTAARDTSTNAACLLKENSDDDSAHADAAERSAR